MIGQEDLVKCVWIYQKLEGSIKHLNNALQKPDQKGPPVSLFTVETIIAQTNQVLTYLERIKPVRKQIKGRQREKGISSERKSTLIKTAYVLCYWIPEQVKSRMAIAMTGCIVSFPWPMELYIRESSLLIPPPSWSFAIKISTSKQS